MAIVRLGTALLALLVLKSAAIGQPATISWPEAVAQLTGERARAEACAGLMKKYGDEAQIARAQLTYANAKADADAVVAGLITALSARQAPEALSSLQTKLSSGLSGRVEFCDTVGKLIPKTDGQKDALIDLAKLIPFETLLKMLSDGVSALYNNHRSDDALTRKTIQTQLEAARWPAFSEVKAAQ